MGMALAGMAPGVTLAQPGVAVVRATDASTPGELSDAVDAALLRDLAEIAGIADPVVSPIDLAEIQLSVGCADEERACLESIARAASVGALLVRALAVDEQGGVRLELRYFDTASSDAPRVVSTERPAHSSGELTTLVPGLVRELFGIPEVAEPAAPIGPPAEPPAHAAPAPAPRSAERDGASLLPWIVIGAGAAALAAGAIVGAVASEDFRAWKKRPIRTTAEADRANGAFDDLETRALAADIAMLSGAVVLGVGVTWLALELGEAQDGTGRATLGVEPRPGGGLLRVQGAFGGAW